MATRDPWLSGIILYMSLNNLVAESPVRKGVPLPLCRRDILSLHICPPATGPAAWAKEPALALLEQILSATHHLSRSETPPSLQKLAEDPRHVP